MLSDANKDKTQSTPRFEYVLLKHNRVDKDLAPNVQSESREPCCLSQLSLHKKMSTKGHGTKRKAQTAPEWAEKPFQQHQLNTVHSRLRAYLSVHSSENGQTATHSTRQNLLLRTKQLVTKPAGKGQKRPLNPHIPDFHCFSLS